MRSEAEFGRGSQALVSLPVDDNPVLRILRKHVAERPTAVAVTDGRREMTWAALSERVTELHARLRAAGVRTDELVAVPAVRGLDWYVLVMALWTARAGYLPVDPAWPRERRADALEIAGPEWLISFDIDRDELVVDPASATGRVLPMPAYVTFTSGTTGKPKGVVNTRQGLHHALSTLWSELPIGPNDTVVQHLPLIFDASLFEVCAALANGATLLLAPPALLPGTEFEEFLAAHGATVIATTPSILRTLDSAALPALTTIICGGEVFSTALAERWLPGRRVFNVYGPTEVCLWSSCQEVIPGEPITIGGPLPGLTFEIADGSKQGTLLISGPAVAAGYLGGSPADAQRFETLNHEERRYDTGDVVEHVDGGRYRFVGRADRQVKVRGFRIELAEIEECLSTVPGVRAAHAYVVGEGNAAVIAAAVVADYGDHDRDHHLRSQLSETHELVDSVYQQDGRAGWRSAFDGRSLAAAVEDQYSVAAQRILDRKPRRVLEIGCGEGGFARHLLADIDSYTGTDLSGVALEVFGSRTDLPECRIELAHGGIGALAERSPEPFDAIVFNSVVQYFPDAGYLIEELLAAAKLLAPNGFLYVGDVRDFDAWDDYARRKLAAERLEPTAGNADVLLRAERELLLSAEFFTRLSGLSDGRFASTVLRRPPVDELARFRYDVILQSNGSVYEGISTERAYRELDAPRCAALANHPLDARRDDDLTARLRARCRASLPPHMAPAGTHVLTRMPLGATGKTADRELPQVRVSGTGFQAGTVLEAAIAEEWAAVLGRDPDSADAHFFHSGGTSLALIELVKRVAARGFELRTPQAFADPTVRGLVQNSRSNADPTLVRLSTTTSPDPDSAPTRIFIHPISGNTECYRPLVNRLGWTAFGVNAASRSFDTEPELVESYLRTLRKLDATDLHIVGWSIGGMIAYKVAAQLHREGCRVRVSLIDTPYPLAADPDQTARWDRLTSAEGPLAEAIGTETDLAHAAALIALLTAPEEAPDFPVDILVATNRSAVETGDPLFDRANLGWPSEPGISLTTHHGGHFDLLDVAPASIAQVLDAG
ncbi:AMP-binding protein [Nocardia tengchongensis]|uniref:AMP-binding protein n=1 Tax=Nocardia tengchongensis TaxID=2055889 RepID=UPI0036CCC078